MTRSESGDADATAEYVIVLDVLRHGRQGDGQRRFDAEPIAYALGESDFRLLELTLVEDADVSIGDRLVVSPTADREAIQSVEEVSYDDLSNTATAEVEYVVEDIVEANEQRFTDFYNDAQPITLRLHQLNLLPGIGKKLRDKILEERKRHGPFDSFEDLQERVSGLHHPKDVIVERIIDELQDNDVKYKTFVRNDG
ncbi:DUF655 domain-containing protein [Haloferax mediterranei ATCC 33500]|uniref:Adenosine deaminase n=1 Tax=Haloferax mediterranei (strain ATCC 33500 / DSM 1411 / JCM 8866 / NBRC 14739 / NCIMB 2177 / R-4) TaxID=523841 RepID=I3R875_HALMT|nr:DUF655 domain-containing protein [Haloferax mediterranei]AFK20435.1 hypothetical protein HFX_2758 [Haloferax mediterranei ATCC 33500]AHZ23797.1 adenosine deaminase [Haloferax mediterranei ATCC 33500]ELZ98219.1 hypothetical protein C439_15580 [Haloferax mediterranei ATCC 33500]MDX5986809.1 DUF655 domain-containing protein [Haloferax mediterranei ATCC 33500]QCQ76133.1 DUF655 domain-containing protein [Haloferax mediterranei ATCC 33500]